ncbi:MAG: DUF4911 domain-containing protein [Nitrospinota bacterium]|nr:DUF4911 domain-containing protein [Nitrospinota bacterium]
MQDTKSSKRICFPAPSQGQRRSRIVFRVTPADISFIVMILESYDYIAIPRTIDPVNGIMEALVSPDFHGEAMSLITALAQESPGLTIIAG